MTDTSLKNWDYHLDYKEQHHCTVQAMPPSCAHTVEFSMGLKITTLPDPSRGFLGPNPTQPDTPA